MLGGRRVKGGIFLSGPLPKIESVAAMWTICTGRDTVLIRRRTVRHKNAE
jgi:hypothetical protein